MSVLSGFVLLLMVLFLGYMGYRLLLRRKLLALISLTLQLLALTVDVLGVTGNVQTSQLAEAGFLLFGILIPGAFFGYDYLNMIRKLRQGGVYYGLVEPESSSEKEPADSSATDGIHEPLPEIQLQVLLEDSSLQYGKLVEMTGKTLLRAQTLIDQKDMEGAEQLYQNLLFLIKDSPGLHYNLGNILYRKGEYAAAQESYKKAFDTRSPFTSMKLNRKKHGGQMDQRKEDSKSKKYSVELHALYYNLGNCSFCLKQYETAAEYYAKAVELDPSLKQARENLARSLWKLGELEKALQFYRTYMKEEEASAGISLEAGLVCMKAGHFAEAVAYLEEYTRRNTSSAEGFKALGEAYSHGGDPEQAVTAFRQYTELAPHDPKAYAQLGTSLIKAGREQEALNAFETSISLDPQNYRNQYNAATLLDDLGRLDEAAQGFKKALDMKPDLADASNNLGIVLAKQGRNLEALRVYEKGLEQSPKDFHLHFNMGIILSQTGRHQQALDEYRQALKICPDPDQQEIFFHMAASMIELKQYDEALEAYKSVMETKPDDCDLFYSLASVYSLEKKYDIALENLKRAVEINQELKRDARSNRAFDSLRSKAAFRELVS